MAPFLPGTPCGPVAPVAPGMFRGKATSRGISFCRGQAGLEGSLYFDKSEMFKHVTVTTGHKFNFMVENLRLYHG